MREGEDEAANGGDGFWDAASDALVETPTVEDAEGPTGLRLEASEWMGCGSEGGAVGVDRQAARSKSRLTIFCDATGAWSSL